jgi:serine/threonine protein kinase
MPTAPSDQNLLFGILALQVNFLTRDGLIQGMNAWVLQKHRPLGDILVEQGALSADNRALLEPLVRRHLEVHDNDAQKSLAALRPAGSVRQDLEQIADPDVETSIAHVATEPARANSWQLPASLVANSRRGRYRRLRVHASGGLGEVFVALDEELNREVALKEIRERFADQPSSRARFLREAEVTGKRW